MDNTKIEIPDAQKDTQFSESTVRIISYVISSIVFFLVYVFVLHPIVKDWGTASSLNSILTKIVFIPVVGMFTLLVLHRDDGRAIKIISTLYCLIPFLLALYLIPFYKGNLTEGMQFSENSQWIRITDPPNPSPGDDYSLIMNINYHIGVDGFSYPLLVLTGLLGLLACIGSWGITKRMKEYFSWYLLLYLAMMGTFVALNYVLFYIFWELMLVPMYFLIGIWGGPRKEYAAIKFFLYTFFGSIFLLVGILFMYFTAGVHDFDMLIIQKELIGKVPLEIGRWIWMATFLGFAIKLPLFPFHTWLPDAHVEAPTAVSVILAGVLLKMGAYGMVRITFPNFPEATHYFVPLMVTLAVVNIVYGACVAMAQDDLKRLVAYSSIGHMGFVLLGFAAFNQEGYTGAYLQVLNHGFISGALFLLVGVVYDRAHIRDINGFGGLMNYMRVYAIIMYICGMANLGLPGLAGFWGEFISLLGAFQSVHFIGASGINMMRVAVVISVFGILITAAYMLWMIQRIFLGVPNEKWKNLKDIDWREQLTLWPLVALIILFGVKPGLLINLFHGSIQGLLEFLNQFSATG
ncbi:MAG: NADH-quinone oxidoreductase subunit M [bacterium]